jgi:hypothetical protein
MAQRQRGRSNRPTTGFAEVQGLAELNLALSRIEPQLRKNLNKRMRKIAADVRDAVRAEMPSRSGRARRSVRAGVSYTGAYVVSGKKEVPYVPWLDFGGTLKPVGGRKGEQRRPVIQGGRYLYPTIERRAPQTREAARQAIEDTKAELGLN